MFGSRSHVEQILATAWYDFYVDTALDVLGRLEPVIQCIDRHFLGQDDGF